MDKKDLTILINSRLQTLFVNKEVDMTADNVNAAIVTAASKMAIPSRIIGQDEVATVLSEDLSDQAKSMIGMGPQYVKEIIGYSVDFNDAGAALMEYSTLKDEYDMLYIYIKQLGLDKQKQI